VFSFGTVVASVGTSGIDFVVNLGFFDKVLSVVPTFGSVVVTESSKDESSLFDSCAVKLEDVSTNLSVGKDFEIEAFDFVFGVELLGTSTVDSLFTDGVVWNCVEPIDEISGSLFGTAVASAGTSGIVVFVKSLFFVELLST
jgi:hypothetical protein